LNHANWLMSNRARFAEYSRVYKTVGIEVCLSVTTIAFRSPYRDAAPDEAGDYIFSMAIRWSDFGGGNE
jgi:hypothetical protein